MDRINVASPSLPDFDEYVNEIRPIWENRHLTNMGPIHDKFCTEIKEYLGVNNVSLFVNGHLALCCALKALGLSGEVITTPFTFASTTNAIVQSGLKPVFCDIKESDYTIDENKIEKLITEKTCAIVPVHVYGNICDVDTIRKIAKKYSLPVIYDAAHAFGVSINGQPIGSFGDISMFSFHATKVFNTIEGGALTYSDDSLSPILSRLKNFGIAEADKVTDLGTNAKMNEFQAAMGICNLRHISGELKLRKNAYLRYIENLMSVKGIRLLKEQKGVTGNYAYFPVVFDTVPCMEIYEALARENIYTRRYFYPLTCDFEWIKCRCSVPIARYVAERVLALPLYAGLLDSDIDRICEIVKKTVERY